MEGAYVCKGQSEEEECHDGISGGQGVVSQWLILHAFF